MHVSPQLFFFLFLFGKGTKRIYKKLNSKKRSISVQLDMHLALLHRDWQSQCSYLSPCMPLYLPVQVLYLENKPALWHCHIVDVITGCAPFWRGVISGVSREYESRRQENFFRLPDSLHQAKQRGSGSVNPFFGLRFSRQGRRNMLAAALESSSWILIQVIIKKKKKSLFSEDY